MKKSNIIVWEYENNYYVYFRKNVEDSYVRGDGYKIGKSNNKYEVKKLEFLWLS